QNDEIVEQHDIKNVSFITINTSQLYDGVTLFSWIIVDSAGNTVIKNLTYFIDNTRPVVNILAPLAGVEINETVKIAWNITETNLKRVLLKIDNITFDVTNVTEVMWNTKTTENGVHTITIIAEDLAGNVGQASIQVNVNNTVIEQQASQPQPSEFPSVLYIAVSGVAGLVTGVLIATLISKKKSF
ncbi:MAG: hypothetical protein J7L07_00750, partial [Candidatus Odinarchaeota archaeon]|nr:hypothetical protein [Candidatus Odinarchaeota archaeon]